MFWTDLLREFLDGLLNPVPLAANQTGGRGLAEVKVVQVGNVSLVVAMVA